MVSESMLKLGTARSVIRELFEFGKKRAAEVGAENIFDFSIGRSLAFSPPISTVLICLVRDATWVARELILDTWFFTS